MTQAKAPSPKIAYKAPHLISFVERVRKGRGYCGEGNSDTEACGDGAAPAYCTNGTIHIPPFCSVGNAATTCASGSGGA